MNSFIRRLSFFLLASVILNGVLISFLLYSYLYDRPPQPLFEQKPQIAKSPGLLNADTQKVVASLEKQSLPKLIGRLKDDRIVENGYTVRDLSLAILSGEYYFDLKRALGRAPEEKVLRSGNKEENLVVYPGLTSDDFTKIDTFLSIERWPFKPAGLFRLLKSKRFKDEPSLQDAFYLTPEFLSVEVLFNRSPVKVERNELLTLLLSGEWGKLAAFYEKQRIAQDLSPTKVKDFLTDYIHQGSKPAAHLLLKTDLDYAVKKLDDKTALEVLELLTDKSDESKQFASEILKSPRADNVRRVASTRLYEYQGNPAPQTIDLAQASLKFLPPNPLAIKPPAPPAIKKTVPPLQKEVIYVVQERDSLWKIAKKFHVDLEEIRRVNQLASDVLKTGLKLKIPVKTEPQPKK